MNSKSIRCGVKFIWLMEFVVIGGDVFVSIEIKALSSSYLVDFAV